MIESKEGTDKQYRIQGGPGLPLPPHFEGPRLCSEAQITPFYTQIIQKIFLKNLPHFTQHTI